MSRMLRTLGFTGTRVGMTGAQKRQFLDLIGGLMFTRFAHGDAIGADAEAHDMIVRYRKGTIIETFPSTSFSQRAFRPSDISHAPEEPLVRNRRIVNAAHVMIATPATLNERTRSGTWSTIRYTRSTGKPLYIIYPDGRIQSAGITK